jgi:CheY-specific phosphatase CheX
MNTPLDTPLDTRWTASLLQAATSTFEELALLFAAPAPAGSAAPDVTAAATVPFDGPRRGRVAVGVSARLLPSIATNMLGFDSAPDAALQRDALGELTNVVCGNVVPSLTTDGAAFRLGAPSAANGAFALATQPGERLSAELALVTDDGDALVRLFLRVDPASPGSTTAAT